MKIKLALLDQDDTYLKRIVSALKTRYADDIEMYLFTDKKMAISAIENSRIDILVADSSFDIDVDAVKKKCGFAFFVDSVDVESYRDEKVVCRYQKIELIYKQILNIYAETSNYIAAVHSNDVPVKKIAFVSASGGAGCSVAAAGCALYFAQCGKKVIYVNLETFGSSDIYFSAEGQFNMSDIIFALKSKKANLLYKLQSCVKTDARGVSFISESRQALDMMEMDYDDIEKLIAEIEAMGTYDYIVMDLEWSLTAEKVNIYDLFEQIVMVGDGSQTSNVKTVRAYEALCILEQQFKKSITERMVIMYNKFSNKTCEVLNNISFKEIGGAPRYENASAEQIVSQLAQTDVYKALM